MQGQSGTGLSWMRREPRLATSSADEVIHGNCFDVQCPVESFSLIYLNPPYDFEVSEERSQRMERLFLEHVYRWLKRTGILVMVIPSDYIRDCSQVLSFQFKDVHVYRLTEPESVKYKQVVGVRSPPHPARERPCAGWRDNQGAALVRSCGERPRETFSTSFGARPLLQHSARRSGATGVPRPSFRPN